jgi:hypothetical protein
VQSQVCVQAEPPTFGAWRILAAFLDAGVDFGFVFGFGFSCNLGFGFEPVNGRLPVRVHPLSRFTSLRNFSSAAVMRHASRERLCRLTGFVRSLAKRPSVLDNVP